MAPVAAPRGSHLADGEELPLVAHALEGADPAVLQRDTGAYYQVTDRPGHQDLARAGGGHDPGAQVHGDPAHVVVPQVDLTGVQPRPDLNAAGPQLCPQRQGAADAATRPAKDRQDAVAGALDQPPALLLDQPPGRLVMEV